MSDNKKKIEVGKLLGPALKAALGTALGPAGIAAGVGVEVVKAVTSANKEVKAEAKEIVVDKVTDTLVAQIAKDPVLINQMNLENPFASRTAQGGAAGAVLSAWLLYKYGWLVPVDQWNIDILYPAFGTFIAGLWVLWGRLAGGLPPAFTWIRSLLGK